VYNDIMLNWHIL